MDDKTIKNEILKKMVDEITKIYGDNLISIVLYGSVARNTAMDDSDIDVALFVKKDNRNMYDRALDVVVDLDLEYDQIISLSLIEQNNYTKWKNVLPYYVNIDKEGIVLWKAA